MIRELVGSADARHAEWRASKIPFRRSAWFWPCVVATLIVSFVWLWARAYQSHYISALRMLGDAVSQTYWGHPREGRGDEWATYLPMLKQAFGEHFPDISSLPPYHEKLEWFISIPHKDLSLLFLPNQLAYWVVPGGVALSFQGLYYNLLLVFSLSWLLRNIGVRTDLAIAAALLLLFSQFYQLWWTSNFPALAAVFLPFAVLTSELRPWLRIPLLSWSVAHVLLGQMYPPFYLAAAIALGPLIFVARPDLLRWRYLVAAGVATMLGLGAYLYLKWDFFTAVSHTTYPGRRVSVGGGGTLSMLLAAILPAFPETSAVPKGGQIFYELSAAPTAMGLLMLAALPNAKWDGFQVRITAVTILVAVVMMIFMLVGFPAKIALLTGFSMIPTNRMEFGLSILVLAFSAITVSHQWDRLRIRHLILVLLLYACLLQFFVQQPAVVLAELDGIRFFPVVALAVAIAGACLSFILNRWRGSAVAATVVLTGFLALSTVTFGSFNPVMRASDILRPVDTTFIRGWKQLYALNGNQPFGMGNYGHVLRGENLPALEAIHMANVAPSTYSRVFPELSAQEVESTFNKFVGVGFTNAAHPDLSGMTILLPLQTHAVDLSSAGQAKTGDANALSGPVQFQITDIEGGRFDVWWSGVLASDIPEASRLVVSAPCEVHSSWVTRQPSAFVGPSAPRLLVVEGHMQVRAAEKAEVTACARNISVFAG